MMLKSVNNTSVNHTFFLKRGLLYTRCGCIAKYCVKVLFANVFYDTATHWCVAVRCGVLQTRCVAVCCSVLQTWCVAVCCSVMQCVAVCCRLVRYRFASGFELQSTGGWGGYSYTHIHDTLQHIESVPVESVPVARVHVHAWILTFSLLVQGETHPLHERWGAGVETQKYVRGEIGGWGRVPFNETYAPSLSTIYDGA